MDQSNQICDPQRLLERARDGSGEAVEALLNYYRPYLMLLARMRGDRQLQAKFDDSDLVQETLLQVHRDLPRFRGTTEAEFAAWIRRIMANVNGKHVRRYFARQRDVSLERQLEDQLSHSSQMVGRFMTASDISPSERTVQRERAVVLSQALLQLSPDYREAMILHRLEGRTMNEIAERMGRSVDSVQKLIARGLLEMRRLLEGQI